MLLPFLDVALPNGVPAKRDGEHVPAPFGGKTMKLRSISIENFRAIEKLSLSFLDDFGQVRPVTVLAGPNGSGKTSVLFAILHALRRTMGYKTDDVPLPSRSGIRRRRERPDTWHDGPAPSVSVELEIEFDATEQQAIPELLKEVQGTVVPPLTDGRFYAKWVYPPRRRADGSERPWWYFERTDPYEEAAIYWLKARGTAIGAWMGRKVPFSVLQDIGGLCLFPQDRNLRQRVLGVSNAHYPGRDEAIQGELGEEERTGVRERSVADILKYLSQYARGQHEGGLPDERNWEKRIQDAFRQICAPKEYVGVLYRGDDPEGAPCFQDGDYRYPLELAASGEQVIIEYLSRLTYPSPLHHSLILIDEPELHLHPAWIRQLYLALPKIGEANQYILTTHSPELRGLAAADRALIDLGQLEGIRV